MKRGGPIQRKTPLSYGRGLVRRTVLRSSPPTASAVPVQRKAPTYTGPTKRVKDATADRDGGVCVPGIVCGHTAEDLIWHHRCNRGMGGSKAPWINEPQNGLLTCRRCNHVLEDEACEVFYANGWKVHRGSDPAVVPVRYPDGSWWLLDAAGGRREVDEP